MNRKLGIWGWHAQENRLKKREEVSNDNPGPPMTIWERGWGKDLAKEVLR